MPPSAWDSSLVAPSGAQGVFEICDETGGDPYFGIFALDKASCFGYTVRPPSDYADPRRWQRGLDPSQVGTLRDGEFYLEDVSYA